MFTEDGRAYHGTVGFDYAYYPVSVRLCSLCRPGGFRPGSGDHGGTEIMSDLERAAAELLRRQRELSAKETAAAEAAEQAHARDQQLLRERAKEFFAFARRHGAPLLRRYIFIDGGQESPHRHERTNDLCVVAQAWSDGINSFDTPRWAVSEDGTVYPYVLEVPYGQPKSVRDERYFRQHSSYADQLAYLSLSDDFAPAAAALLESLPLPGGLRTGVQDGGWIGYRRG
ncbi:hypothetical protein [Streptomyces sp. NPDC004284]|uniref:hypothetical protein n=1 Tax=Streptomyces sp. NPDC004284 TaxID=3364695 RepID=UPI003692BA5F